jgi:hypothetical protein
VHHSWSCSLDTVGCTVVVIASAPEAKASFRSSLHAFEVIEPRPSHGTPAIPQTTVCGHVITLNQCGKPHALVNVQIPAINYAPVCRTTARSAGYSGAALLSLTR